MRAMHYHVAMKQELQKIINRINSQLLLPNWQPRRADYDRLRNELKAIKDADDANVQRIVGRGNNRTHSVT